MRKHSKYILLFCLFFSMQKSSISWGFFAHKKINRMAVFCLPPEMIGFYKWHIEYLTEHAVDPDKRRYASETEAPRHYIDIDHFATGDTTDPFENMPRNWEQAVAKYTEDTLLAYGIVPWQVSRMVYSLTKAFEKGDADFILYLSANLGHYVADAHVPLHTTENYNGQLSGQKGIHAFWESRLPELLSDEYDFLVGRAEYVEDPLELAWKTVEDSHMHLDSVLLVEKRLSRNFPSDLKYTFEKRGKSTVKQYSRAYSLEYHRLLNGMVEERMRKAIFTVGSLWYTAWVNAGQPDLSKLLKESKIRIIGNEAGDLNERRPIGNKKDRIQHTDEKVQ